jgi:outer membrane usher protein
VNTAARWVRAAAPLLAALALLVTTWSARAEEDQRAVVTLILNEVKRGEIIVVLRGADVLVAQGDLHAATVLPDALRALGGRSEAIMDKPYLSLTSLSPKLRFAFDEGALTVKVTVPPELLPTSVIDLRLRAPSDIERRADTSAFLNYALSLADFREPGAFAEAGVSLDGALFSTAVSASLSRGVARGLSSLVIDEPKGLQRWTLGDSFVSSGELGGGVFVGGVSVSKAFELDPYFGRAPSLGYAGSALTPSTLEVYVDGALRRSQAIEPGPFRVDNLAVATGSGEVRYVLRDAFGDERSVSSPYSMAAGQLAEGVSEYTYALGFRREGVGQESFRYTTPGFLGAHRVGLSKGLTAGARIEASPGLVSGGASLACLLPSGSLSLAAAASGGPLGAGLAGSASYAYMSRRFGLSVSARAVSDRYVTLSLGADDKRDTLQASALTSLAVTPRWSLSSQVAFLLPRDAPFRFSLGALARVSLTKGLSLSISAGRSIQGDLRATTEASLAVSYSFPSGLIVSGGAKASESGPEISAAVNKPVPASTGFGFSGAAQASAHPRASAAAQYQGTYGRYQASASVAEGGPHLALEASGAIVALEGAGLFLTRPIQNGFAVVRVPGVPGVRGYLDNREVGRTGPSGDLLIPNLLPYYGNRVSIDDQDLPMDYSIDKTEILLSPPRRGGALLVFAAKKRMFYRGRVLIRARSAEAAPAYGDLDVGADGATVTSPLGKGGEFELADLTPGRYPAKVTHAGGECLFTFIAPDAGGPVIDMGAVVCAEEGEK